MFASWFCYNLKCMTLKTNYTIVSFLNVSLKKILHFDGGTCDWFAESCRLANHHDIVIGVHYYR